MILLIIMFATLNNKLTIICSHSHRKKRDCLYSDRIMYIKLKLEFQTGSDKMFTGHVTHLESSVWGVRHTSITASNCKSNLVSYNNIRTNKYNVCLGCLSTLFQKLSHFPKYSGFSSGAKCKEQAAM